ncbi:hypothetical protein BDP27DRAFT_1332820 [Rhodocollybia butyracea]|uniref:Uncharacterized protein n=1 Tax=Rhodocollybia butyracea TaxID=206335 RepID=A0A9P5PFX9_9AGAR|nr:hypothetical protein BDP27DRAFT_1332820 [Rhodocollybia butyracea]
MRPSLVSEGDVIFLVPLSLYFFLLSILPGHPQPIYASESLNKAQARQTKYVAHCICLSYWNDIKIVPETHVVCLRTLVGNWIGMR